MEYNWVDTCVSEIQTFLFNNDDNGGYVVYIFWSLFALFFCSILAMPPKKKNPKSTTVASKRKAAVLSESENEQNYKEATKSKLATVASKRKQAILSESENEDGNEKSSLRYSFFFFITMTVPDPNFSDDNFIISDDENVNEYDVEYVFALVFFFMIIIVFLEHYPLDI